MFGGRLQPAVWTEHEHREIQISIVGRGGETVAASHSAAGRSRVAIVRPGRVAIVPSGQPHTIDWRVAADVRTLYLAPEMLSRWGGRLCRGPVEIIEGYDIDDPLLKQLVTALIDGLAQGEDRLYNDALITALVAHLATCFGVERNEPEGGGAPALDRVRLRRVLDLMHDRMAGEVRLEELAREARLSPFHFSRCFRSATGESPCRYLVQLRIQRAAELLRDPSLSLAQVALMVGYSSQGRFSEMFKKALGVTPGFYRRSVLM